MKILRIFSVVVGIHVFALVLIFANPGCSSPNKPAPSPSDTVSQTDESSSANPRAGSDQVSPVVIAGANQPRSSVPSSFDPSGTATPDIRFSPTRPGTPAASTLESQAVGDVTPATTYTVAKGDSLWTIAKKHGVSVAEIAAANNIKPNATIRLGQKLIVPAKTVSIESRIHGASDEIARVPYAGADPTAYRRDGDTCRSTPARPWARSLASIR